MRTLIHPDPREAILRLQDRLGSTAPPTLDLVSLQDGLIAAGQAVAYWEQELGRRVAELQALDGLVVSVFSALMGTREERLDAAELAVRGARARLVRAREGLKVAQAALAEGELAHQRGADAAVIRLGELELAADALRGTSHPLAERLELLEAEADELRSELSCLAEAIQVGSALRAYLGARSMAREGPTSPVSALARATVLGRFAQTQQRRALAQDQEEIVARARRFEEACAALGLDVRIATEVAGPDTALQLMDLASGLVDAPLGLSLVELQHADSVQARRESVREDVLLTLEGLSGRRAQIQAKLEALDSARRELLEGLGRR
ncbi:MAG TPA: hypothetical protein ENK18_18515 [Deltaproteobacteria bacterium]|nr:hypothetical protein [Deltaproteobacteria bacterium]